MLETHLEHGLQHAGRRVRHDDVDPIEVLGKFRKDLGHALRNADTSLDRRGAPTHRANLGAQRLGFVVTIVIVDRDVGAALGQLAGDRATDATGSAGDERNLTSERACHRSVIGERGKPLF